MSKLKDILKQYRTLLRRSDARWRKLLCPYPIDPEAQQADDVRWRTRYDWFIWIVLGTLGLLAEVLVFPQIDKMLMIPLLVFAFLVAFCAIMQNSRIKKSPAGRKEKAKLASFEECFVKKEDFVKVDQYIRDSFSSYSKMKSGQAIALIMAIREAGMSNEGEAPLASFLIKDYGPLGILSFDSVRAATSAKRDNEKKAAVMSVIAPDKPGLPNTSK